MRRSIIDFAIHPLGEFSNFLFQVIYSNMQNKVIRVIIKKRLQVMYHIISLGSQQGQSFSFPLLPLLVALFGVGNTVCFFAAAAVFASGVSAFVVFRIIVIVVKNEGFRSVFTLVHACTTRKCASPNTFFRNCAPLCTLNELLLFTKYANLLPFLGNII